MGMYTEIYVKAVLKENVDDNVINILKYMLGIDDVELEDFTLPSHSLFKTDRWDDLTEEEQSKAKEADLVIGHPECGNFSILNTRSYNAKNSLDIPFFVDIVNKVKPKFFLADNLPKSLLSFSLIEWHDETENDYNVYPLWVSNFGYGNSQKHRNRLFILGVRKDQDFTFVPDEREHDTRVEDLVWDLPPEGDPSINHIFKKDSDPMTGFTKYYFTGNP